MKLTQGQKEFLQRCLSLEVVNVIPQATKLRIPEMELRKYLRRKKLLLSPDGFFVMERKKARPAPKLSEADKDLIRKALIGDEIPEFLIEYLKLQVIDDLWGKYHCTHALGPVKAWELRSAQRARFEEAMRQEMVRFALTLDHKTIKAARKAYLNALEWTDAPKEARG